MTEPDPPQPIVSATSLWIMRVLALAALAVGGFLLYLHLGYQLFARTSKVPFCGWASWLDCDAVLYHPKWSHVLGVPVALPGVLLYLAVLFALFRVGRSPTPRVWWFLHFAGVLIILAAAWFVYVQLVEIRKLCQYCMIEHALGVALALLLINTARRRRAPDRALSYLFAVAVMGVVAGQQLFYEPPRLVRIVEGAVDASNRYAEEGANVSIAGGVIRMSADAHPLLGDANAKHVIVEVIDYTCPRCAGLHKLIHAAGSELGGDFAFLVLTYPLNHACNPAMQETEPRHAEACFLARLAHAVWLTDPAKFEAFHGWLFENQDDMTRDKAIAHAGKLVDAGRLHGWLADEKLDAVLKRDVQTIAPRLMDPKVGYLALPLLYASDYRVTNIPDTPEKLAESLREAVGK